MDNLIEILKTVLPSLFALLLLFIGKKHEINVNRSSNLLEKKRECFYEVISLITKTIISIKAGYSIEEDNYLLIVEKDCDEFELEMKTKMLYLNDNDIIIIKFIIQILRQNSSWQYDIVSHGDSVSFNFKDILVIEYLNDILTKSFREQLSNKKLAQKLPKEILCLKLGNIYVNMIRHKDLIDEITFSKYNYMEHSITEIIDSCKKNNDELMDILQEIIVKYGKRNDNSDYDKMRIEELSDLMYLMRK
jgi:hypothetical protein